MRFTDTFIKMNSCVVGRQLVALCVIKFAIVYENFGVATVGRPFDDWSSLLFEWNVYRATIGRLFVWIEIQ